MPAGTGQPLASHCFHELRHEIGPASLYSYGAKVLPERARSGAVESYSELGSVLKLMSAGVERRVSGDVRSVATMTKHQVRLRPMERLDPGPQCGSYRQAEMIVPATPDTLHD